MQQMPSQSFGNQQGFAHQQPPPVMMQQGQNIPFQPRMMQNQPQQQVQPPLQPFSQLKQQPPPRTNLPPFNNPQQNFPGGSNIGAEKAIPQSTSMGGQDNALNDKIVICFVLSSY